MTFIPNITLLTQLLSDTSTPPYPCFIWTVRSLATDDRHFFVYPAPCTIKDSVGSPLHNLTNSLSKNSICGVSKVSILPQFIFNSYMEQQAETVLNQVPAICRQYTTLSVPPHTSHITTTTTDQLLHEQQPTTLEERERKKIQESVATSPFLCMSMVGQ